MVRLLGVDQARIRVTGNAKFDYAAGSGERVAEFRAILRQLGVTEDAPVLLAGSTFPRFSFDLIYARPGQTVANWEAELNQALVLAGKVRALLEGRYNVSFEDIRRVYLPALRHRVLLNFEAQAENIASDTVLAQILNEVSEKASDVGAALRV